LYALEVRDHIMIAHSLPGEFFGPAQKMHGATFIVDVAFYRETLDEHNVVVDIGKAAEALAAVLKPINYANLDEIQAFRGQATTTEFLCRYIFNEMAKAVNAGRLGPGSEGILRLKVTLHESHVARASYEGPVAA
jgi:6-pyruvoyl-tetrahydropterin synthase